MKDNRINLEKSSTIWRSYRDSFQESELSIWLVKNRQWWLTKWIMASIRNVKQNLSKNIFKGSTLHSIYFRRWLQNVNLFRVINGPLSLSKQYQKLFQAEQFLAKLYSSNWQRNRSFEKEVDLDFKNRKKERESKDVLNEIRKERESSER